MSAEEMFHSELPDIRAMINKLNAFDEKANKAIRDGINKGGDIILAEQKRLISTQKVGKRLSKALKKSRLTVSKKHFVSVSTGYQEDSFNVGAGDKYWQKESDGIIGLTYEFGRPGQSPQRSGGTMKQTRKRRKKIPVSSKRKNAKGWKYSEAEPTEVTIKKGAIAPVPHIRRGFDNVVEKAAEAVANKIEPPASIGGEYFTYSNSTLLLVYYLVIHSIFHAFGYIPSSYTVILSEAKDL